MLFRFSLSYLTRMANRCVGSAIPDGCRNSPLITLNITALAATPSASVRTATVVKPGFFASILIPYRKS